MGSSKTGMAGPSLEQLAQDNFLFPIKEDYNEVYPVIVRYNTQGYFHLCALERFRCCILER